MNTLAQQGERTRCGPYTVGEVIGQGAQGTVHRGYRVLSGGAVQEVCLKLLRHGVAVSSKLKKAFATETEIAARLQHQNIVHFIEADAADPAGGWIALELVRGVNLRDLMRSQPDGRLPPKFAILIAAALCKAFVYLHDQRRGGKSEPVVHRDVTATNVLVSYAGAVKLADFGVARIVRSTRVQTTVGGTVHYMAPEQALGRHVDGRCDLFALGVLLYEMLAGHLPVEELSDYEITAHLSSGDYPPLSAAAPDVPAGLTSLVAYLLQPKRENRCPDARMALRLLSEFVKTDLFIELDAELELGAMARNVTRARIATIDPEQVIEQSLNTRPAPQEVQNAVTQLGARMQRRAGKPMRRWVPLALTGVLASLGVAAAWPQREASSAQVTAVVADSGHARTELVEPPAQQQITTPVQTPSTGGNSDQSIVAAPAAASAAPPNEIPSPGQRKDHSDKKASSSEAAFLTIGAGTSAHVWVDGRSVGWSPVPRHKVRPGRHSVTVGTDAPDAELAQVITVRGGEQRDVYFGD